MQAPKLAILPLPRGSYGRGGDASQGAKGALQPRSRNTTGRPANKARASKPKTKSGCLTCKIRHIKCDETKPKCEKCTSTGRICDGYASALSGGAGPQYAFLTLPPVTSADSLCELRAFSHFRNHSAPTLSSFFDSEFWMQLVLQVSSAEPAVRHAVIAFDTLSEKKSVSTTPSSTSYPENQRQNEDWRNDQFAIVQYNKAIECLTQPTESASSVDVIMIVCILFICIEALRGDIETATMHFNGGMKTALSRMSASPVDANLETRKRLEHHFLPFLCRMELLSILFYNSPPWPYPFELSEAVPAEFTKVAAARHSMIHIQNITMRFVRDVTGRRRQERVSTKDYLQQAELRQALEDWATRHDTMLAQSSKCQEVPLASQMLRLHHLIAYIFVSRSTEAAESAADRLLPEYETALSLAENIAEAELRFRRQASDGRSIFLFDMEIVAPTYFIAAKCRHPQLRRRAIALLRTLRRREGFFDSDLAAALAERIMSIEEVELTVFDGSEYPHERRRVHHTDIKTAFELDGRIYNTTFFMKPDGQDGPWYSLQEKVGFWPIGNDNEANSRAVSYMQLLV